MWRVTSRASVATVAAPPDELVVGAACTPGDWDELLGRLRHQGDRGSARRQTPWGPGAAGPERPAIGGVSS